MNRDVPVCDVAYNEDLGRFDEVGTLRNPAWAPPSALRQDGHIDRGELDFWWASRLVPARRFPRVLEQRPVFRRLFRATCGLSLTDLYWLRPAGSDLAWEDINFFENPFDEAVGRELLGTMGQSEVRDGDSLRTPSATANGMLRKYWRIAADGTRELAKAASTPERHEPANEYAASAVTALLLDEGDFVPYAFEVARGEAWSVCPCFTDSSHEYVPASGLFPGDAPLYGPEAHDALRAFGVERGVPGMDEALAKMIVVDALIDNNDRHFGNFGLLRNVRTLAYERVAPLFDFGSSFWTAASARPSFAPFARTANEQLDLAGSLGWLRADRLAQAPKAAAAALRRCGVAERELECVLDGLTWRAEMIAGML
jgi:hypothetical protein